MSIAAVANQNDLSSILKKAKIQLVSEREVIRVSKGFTDLQNVFGRAVTYMANINRLKDSSVKNELRNHKLLQQKRVTSKADKNNYSLIGSLNAVGSSIDSFVEASKNQSSGLASSVSDVLSMVVGGRLGAVGKLGKLGRLGAGLGAGALALDIGDRMLDGQDAGQIGMGVGGGALGMAGGSILGARLGASAGPVGAAVGGLIGGAAGYMAGGKAGDATNNYLTKKEAPQTEGYSRKFADFVAGSIKNVTTFLSLTPLGLLARAGGALYDAGSDFVEGFSDGWNGNTPASGNAATEQAMNYFMSQGWTKEQAAGIVGNLQVESGNFSPDIVSGKRRGDSGKAMGIAQWHPDRQQIFARTFGRSLMGAPLEAQLQFIQKELTSNERLAGNKLRATKTASEAATVVDRFYERSSGEARGQRIANANALAGNQGFFKTAGQYAGAAAGYVTARGGQVIGGMRDAAVRGITGIGRFLFPVTAPRITSPFGMRVHPKSGRYKMHTGIDLGAKRPGVSGDPVFAAADGVVVRASRMGGYGNVVDIAHSNGIMTRYAHLQRIFVGGRVNVTKGQPIAAMGSTGVSTGAHLHFEVRKNGSPVNPVPLLGKGAVIGLDANATEDDGGAPKPADRQRGWFAKDAQAGALRRRRTSGPITQPAGGRLPFLPVAGAKPKRGNGSMIMANPKPQYTWYFGS